jgi:hypothetical protein
MPAPAPEAPNLEAAASSWQHALDADQRALTAVTGIVQDDELARHRSALGVERRETAQLLVRLARTLGVPPPRDLEVGPTDRNGVAGFPQADSGASPMASAPPGSIVWASGRTGVLAARKGVEMRKWFEYGGAVAAIVLIVFGVVAIVMGVNGRNTVRDSLKQEAIVGTPDMNRAAIAAEAKKAGLPASIKLPTADVAGKQIDTGARARAFATYMRIHTLEATGGLTYSQLPRYATTDGKGTNDATHAVKGANGQPLDNPVRQIWITETALTTALNSSYLAENVAMFGIVVGVALLLTGGGFGILVFAGSLRGRERAFEVFGQRTPETTGTSVPVA